MQQAIVEKEKRRSEKEKVEI